MQAPSAGPQPSGPTPAPTPATASSPAPAATETVVRPEPGLARGAWEAPAWALWVALFAILAASTAYLLRRLGVLRFGGSGSKGTPGQ